MLPLGGDDLSESHKTTNLLKFGKFYFNLRLFRPPKKHAALYAKNERKYYGKVNNLEHVKGIRGARIEKFTRLHEEMRNKINIA